MKSDQRKMDMADAGPAVESETEAAGEAPNEEAQDTAD